MTMENTFLNKPKIRYLFIHEKQSWGEQAKTKWVKICLTVQGKPVQTAMNHYKC